MSILAQRGGQVHVRTGGNSQEAAQLVPSLPKGTMMAKSGLNLSAQVLSFITHSLSFSMIFASSRLLQSTIQQMSSTC
jgi:hypothetical protein